jgi:predicted CXXCH cytochrome family protein
MDQTSKNTGSATSAPRQRGRLVTWLVLAVGLLVIAGLYRYIVSGGLTARQKPTTLESTVAQALVDFSIPRDAKAQKNPLEGHDADLAAGRDLYRAKCEACHGYDGRDRTPTSGGFFPPAVDLQSAQTAKRTDGELFYFIRNGVRNTAMPAWPLTDQQTWQLVVYLRQLPKTAAVPPSAVAKEEHQVQLGNATYAGSAACQKCHQDIYDRWKKTLMANVVRDPREHPDAIIPDLAHADPMVKFTVDDITMVYGSKWKQRYFKKVGDDYYVLPAQWDVTNKKWKPYFVKDDWWAPLYPPDNMQRPTGALCDGCHSVNYDIKTKTPSEWNVGCEKCHGPGSAHVQHPVSNNILNPARMDYIAGADTCIQCHSQGRPLTNPIDGKYYDWPVGFQPGSPLKDYWQLEEHKLGETTFTHFPDGTAHKNRMQGNDFVTSLMYTHGVSCYTCHDAHGTDHPALLRKPANELCLDCHGPNSPSGPFAPTLEAHTHHKAGSAGSECIACHMPKIAQTLPGVNVRSHTFRFVTPSETEAMKIPNACNVCHSDKTTTWASEALRSWADRSPWRTGQ